MVSLASIYKRVCKDCSFERKLNISHFKATLSSVGKLRLIRMLIITNSYCLITLVFACNGLVSSRPRTSEHKLLQTNHSTFVNSPSASLFSAVPCSLLGDALVQADHTV